jgi:hypothetical protein
VALSGIAQKAERGKQNEGSRGWISASGRKSTFVASPGRGGKEPHSRKERRGWGIREFKGRLPRKLGAPGQEGTGRYNRRMKNKGKQQHQTYTCPVAGCGRGAEYRQFLGEEIPVPTGTSPSTLKRIPPRKAVARNIEVECPVHGRKIILKIGHHSDLIGKRKRTSKKTS